MFRVSSNINTKLSSGLGTFNQNSLNIFFTQNQNFTIQNMLK